MKQELANELLSVLKEYNELGIAEQIDYQKCYLASVINNSAALSDPYPDPIDPINTTIDPIKSFSDPITDRLYNEILLDNSLNYLEYAEKLGVSEATVKRRLGDLKKDGIIVRVGSNKTGHWKIM